MCFPRHGRVPRRTGDFRETYSGRSCGAIQLSFRNSFDSQPRYEIAVLRESPADAKVRSGNDHDGCLPEHAFLACGVQNRDLAIVTPGRKLIEIDAEADRHCSDSIVPRLNHFLWLRLESFGLPTIKTHECDQGLNARGILFIGLEVNVHLTVPAKHPRHAGNEFLAVLSQGIDGFVLAPILLLAGVVQRILEFDALATQDDRTHWNPLGFLIQVRNDE